MKLLRETCFWCRIIMSWIFQVLNDRFLIFFLEFIHIQLTSIIALVGLLTGVSRE